GFPGAITSITLSTGGATGTFAGTDFDLNSVGASASFFAAQLFTPNLSSDLPFDLSNLGIGFPQDPLPGSFDSMDLTTYSDIFPNTFTFQFTYDNFAFAEGMGLATLVPEPSAALLLLLGLPFLRLRRQAKA
ncbi:MAG: PEP-CTERM sorting domain-containing protein, partial [Planctomycetota bacterium]